MNNPNNKNIAGFIEALQIFACYLENGLEHEFAINAEHDEIYGPDMPIPDSPQGRRLKELGWHRDKGQDYWAYFT
jgi:hypothetical protein